MVDRETDVASAIARVLLREVLAVRHRGDVFEEASFVLFLGREVEGKTHVGAGEAAMHVTVPHRCIAPFVDVDIGFGEKGIGGGSRRNGLGPGNRLWRRRCSFARNGTGSQKQSGDDAHRRTQTASRTNSG
ncbi:hypothetical protein ACFSLT_17365 [Novosphingobium resinovorum]